MESLRMKISLPKNPFLQAQYLENLIKEKTEIAVYLKTGIKLTGQLVSHSQKVIFLKREVIQAISKHAISTLQPADDLSAVKLKKPQ
jgi:RNA chaperone Hfq